MKRILTCAALLLGAAAAAENPKVTITGLRSDRGLVLWTLQGADNTHRQGMEQPAAGQDSTPCGAAHLRAEGGHAWKSRRDLIALLTPTPPPCGQIMTTP